MKDARDDDVAQDMKHGAVVFRIVERLVESLAFTPADKAFGIYFDKQCVPVFKLGEACLERMLERIQNADNIYAVNSHNVLLSSMAESRQHRSGRPAVLK